MGSRTALRGPEFTAFARRPSRRHTASRHRAPHRGALRRSAARAAHAEQPALRFPAAAAMAGCHGLARTASGAETAVARRHCRSCGRILRPNRAVRRAQPMAAASLCGYQQRVPSWLAWARLSRRARKRKVSARAVTVGTDDIVGDGAKAAPQLKKARAAGSTAPDERPSARQRLRNSLSG